MFRGVSDEEKEFYSIFTMKSDAIFGAGISRVSTSRLFSF
jgi:hypothetical protein